MRSMIAIAMMLSLAACTGSSGFAGDFWTMSCRRNGPIRAIRFYMTF